MGWAPRTARSHATRLTREGWVARLGLAKGKGSLLYSTRVGVRVAELPLAAAPDPAPVWWAHLAACAWVAAWLTARGRGMVGPRELLEQGSWRGELEGPAGRRARHRPDLVGIVPGRKPAAIEVELSRKSKTRLRAILALHTRWVAGGLSGGCVYVCGDDSIAELVGQEADRVGLRQDERILRIELLATVKREALDASPRRTAVVVNS